MDEKAYSTKQLITNPNTFKLATKYLKDLLIWWFIEMPVFFIKSQYRINQVLNDKLSVFLLIKTFFLPWKRDYKFIGYFFGIVMRILYIPIAVFIILSINIFYLLFIIIWIFLPIFALFFMLFGFLIPL